MKKFYSLFLLPINFFVRPLCIIPALIGAGAVLGASLLNNYYNKKNNKKNADVQNKINAENLAFQREQFNEQQYLNRNQIQLQAADAQKAGINPMALNSGVLSAGSYNSTSQAPESVANNVDISPLISILTQSMANKTSENVAEKQAESSKYVADKQAETAENVARINAQNQQEMLATRLTQEDRQFQEKLAQDFSIANIQAELERQGLEQQKSIEAAKRVSEQLKRNDDYQIAMQNIRIEEEKIKNAKDASERDAAVRSSNGWKAFAASIFHTVVNGAISFVGGRTNSGTSNPIGFSAN